MLEDKGVFNKMGRKITLEIRNDNEFNEYLNKFSDKDIGNIDGINILRSLI